jgi:cytochrome c oxidase subunit 1
MTLWLVAIILFIGSSLLGGINYISTVLNMRTKGMSMMRLPLTVWALFLTAVLGLLSFPVLLGGGLLLMFDRGFGTSFYLSDIWLNGAGALEHTGGSPVLFQHLFWFLGHPEVYIVLLPALGLSSEIIATNSRKPIFGCRSMGGQLIIQLTGIAAVLLWSLIVSFVIAKVVQAVSGLRVSPETEEQGLDLRIHGERGYNM